MGIQFAAEVGKRKSAIIPAGLRSDSAMTQARPRIGEGFRPCSAQLGPAGWTKSTKKGRPQGERPREEILLLLHCFVPQCGTTQESRIPSTMSTINYTAIVNIS
jgi:hypothetical protein